MPLSPEEFSRVYPLFVEWVDGTLAQHAPVARSVATVGFRRLPLYYRATTLAAAKVVIAPKLPMPPLARFGLTQFAEWERTEYGGVTYRDTFIVTPAFAADESLYFHELIHVVQWRLLGLQRFVAAYADGLERFGYRESPLEKMAYDAQARFDAGEVFDAEARVTKSFLNVGGSHLT